MISDSNNRRHMCVKKNIYKRSARIFIEMRFRMCPVTGVAVICRELGLYMIRLSYSLNVILCPSWLKLSTPYILQLYIEIQVLLNNTVRCSKMCGFKFYYNPRKMCSGEISLSFFCYKCYLFLVANRTIYIMLFYLLESLFQIQVQSSSSSLSVVIVYKSKSSVKYTINVSCLIPI